MAKTAAVKQTAATKRPAAKKQLAAGKAPATTRRATGASRPATRRAPQAASAKPRVPKMHDVPNVELEEEFEQLPDQPFAESSVDAVDPDLRHRLVSEAAYRRYTDRGYADGYDLDDWLQAEAEVDHLLLNPKP